VKQFLINCRAHAPADQLTCARCKQVYKSLRRAREHVCKASTIPLRSRLDNTMLLHPVTTISSDSEANTAALVESLRQLLNQGVRSRLLRGKKLPTLTLLPQLQQQFDQFLNFISAEGVQPGRRGNTKEGKTLESVKTSLRRFIALVPVSNFEEIWFFVRQNRGTNLNLVVSALQQGEYSESTIRNTFYALQQALPFAHQLVHPGEPTRESQAEIADLANSINQLISQSHRRSVINGDEGRKLRMLEQQANMQDVEFPKKMLHFAEEQFAKWQHRVIHGTRMFGVCYICACMHACI